MERCDKSNQGLPICNNNFTRKACLYIKSTTGPTQPILMADHRPTTLRPKKMLYPSLHKHKCIAETPPHQSPVTSHQSPHEAATAPPRRRRGKRRLDERSAQARGARGEAVQAGERRRLGHRAASPQVASRSNLDSLKSGQRLGLPRIDVLCVNSFRSRERFNK